MSTWYRDREPCAYCGKLIEAELARGVHASRAPAVRDKVLRGHLHRAQCAACGHVQEIVRPLVYTDFPRGQWIEVAVPGDLPRWLELERETLERAERALQHGAPAAAEIADRMRVRLVFGTTELREKLVIWEAGLDDSIVECVKLLGVRERPALHQRGSRILVEAVTPGGDLDLSASTARWTTPASVVARAAAEAADWSARFPELFRDGFVSIDRHLLVAETAS